jgi:hypothetical protein
MYIASFHGRRLGDIGRTYVITSNVEGETEAEAHLNLYAFYEHITRLELQKVHPNETEKQTERRLRCEVALLRNKDEESGI